MEGLSRKPYQGLINVVRFNWHFYVLAGMTAVLLVIASVLLGGFVFWLCIALAVGIIAATCVSLAVSHHVYDRSGLYRFRWVDQFDKAGVKRVLNVHAGFDETSFVLRRIFPEARLDVFDFYDPDKHTEVSIKRARKEFPPYEGTVKIASSNLPVADKEVDLILNIFALHEIRDRGERIRFLQEQCRALCDEGKAVVVEHLRDVSNFLAYNIGVLHFLPGREWNANFQHAGFCIDNELKITPFVTVFILRKADGDTP